MSPLTTSHFDIGSHTDKGRQRADNQDDLLRADAWFAQERVAAAGAKALRSQRGRLYIVADGVGGNDDGALASRMTVNAVMEHYYAEPAGPASPSASLARAITRASRDIADRAAPSGSTMASTVVAALIRDNALVVANVGDSSAWLFRRGQRPEKLSTDHIHVDGQGRRGLSQAMGDTELRPALRTVRFEPDDVVVLCTDGLTDLVRPEEIGGVVRGRPAGSASRALIRLANARGGHDNITALVLRHGALPLLGQKRVWQLLAAAMVLLALAALLALQLPKPPTALSEPPHPSPTARVPQHTVAAVAAAPLVPTTLLVVPTATPAPIDTPTLPPAPPRPTRRPTSAPRPTALARPTAEPAPAASPTAEPPQPKGRAFAAVVGSDFRGSGQSGQRQSCVAGRVVDRAGQGVAAAVLEANNGVATTQRVETDGAGAYRICGLGDSVWSVVLMYVPGETPLRASAVTTVYVNGSGEQVATVSFNEQ